MKKNRIKAKGGYSQSSVESGALDHDGQSDLYFRDKAKARLLRFSERERYQEVVLEKFLASEEVRWRELLPEEFEKTINEACLVDRHGIRVSAEERKRGLAVANVERAHYRLPNGKLTRIRSHPYATDPFTHQVLRDARGKKIRLEVAAHKVENTYHDSYQIDPRISYMIVEAYRAGHGSIVEAFVKEGAKDVIRLFENFTSLEVLYCPLHVSYLSSHYQPDFVVVSADERRLGSSRLVHLGKTMAAIARWERMDLGAKDVAAITVDGGFAALKDAIEIRGKKAVDLHVEAGLDALMRIRLADPRFAPLRPFFRAGQEYYSDYLARRAAALSGTDVFKNAEAEKAAAEARAAREQALRKNAEDNRAAAEKRAAEAEAQRKSAEAEKRRVEEQAARAELDRARAESEKKEAEELAAAAVKAKQASELEKSTAVEAAAAREAAQRAEIKRLSDALATRQLAELAAEKRARFLLCIRALLDGRMVPAGELMRLGFNSDGEFESDWSVFAITLAGATSPPTVMAEVAELRQMLLAYQAQRSWTRWETSRLAEAVQRIIAGNGRGEDLLLRSSFGALRQDVADELRRRCDRGGSDQANAEEALNLIATMNGAIPRPPSSSGPNRG